MLFRGSANFGDRYLENYKRSKGGFKSKAVGNGAENNIVEHENVPDAKGAEVDVEELSNSEELRCTAKGQKCLLEVVFKL